LSNTSRFAGTPDPKKATVAAVQKGSAQAATSSSNHALGNQVLSCEEKNVAVIRYFTNRALSIKASLCDCNKPDWTCDAHVYIELVRNAVLSCIAEAESATETRRKSRPHLEMVSMCQLLPQRGNPDSPTEGQINEFITYLRSIKTITETQRKLAQGEQTSVSGGGGGSLSFDKNSNAFIGRPAFDDQLIKRMPVGTSQHRRHIIPWHHIRAFVNACLEKQIGMSDLDEALATIQIHGEGRGMLARATERTAQMSAPMQKWGKALILMNSCHANLWVGSGVQNVSINSNFFAISNTIAAWEGNHEKMIRDLIDWSTGPVKHNKKIIVDALERCYVRQRMPPRKVLGVSSSGNIAVMNWKDWLKEKKSKDDDVLLVELRSEASNFAQQWALTSLCYDIPVTAVDPKIVHAITAIHRVVQGDDKPTPEDAKAVFAALLQVPG
jgi:hypothetical protein